MISEGIDESHTSGENREEPQSVRVLPLWMGSSCSKEHPSSEKMREKSSKVQGVRTSPTVAANFQCKTQESQEQASAKLQYILQSENDAERDSCGNVTGNNNSCQREDASETNKTQKKDYTEASERGLAFIGHECNNSTAVESARNVEQISLSEESCMISASSSKEESVCKTAASSSEGEIQTENYARLPRVPCTYGAKCYRRNQTHLDMRSHPGDDDFVDNRPECEYGTSCYRKNVLHNEQYKHTGPVANKRTKPETQENDSKNHEDSEPEESDISVSESDSYEPFDSEKSPSSSDDEDDEYDDKAKPKLLKRRRRR